MLQGKERDILRALVGEYMQFATLPEQKEKIRLWKALNRGAMERPMVVMDQLPWNELRCDELQLQITEPYWRGVERNLRAQIYQYKRFPVDMVLDPFISIYKSLHHTGYGLNPEIEKLGAADTSAFSQHYTKLLNNLDDVAKITDWHVTHDVEETERHCQEAAAMFGDLASVRPAGHIFHLGVWDYLAQLMGVEDIYFAFIDEPELLHAAMERATASTICSIEDANACGGHSDITNTCHCSYTYTDDLLPDSGQGKGATSKNTWAFGLAQLFSSVSPELFAEFEFPYIAKMAEYFGYVYYGCCDRMDDRLDIVKKIPNVRKVSCSPWSDRAHFAEQIGPSLVMSNKPTPAFLATASFDEDVVRKDLQYTCRLAKENGANLELILKDVSTVSNEPERLVRWADIAMEVVQSV